MTMTQTGRRLALVGLLAIVAAMLPLSGASAISGTEAVQLSATDNVSTSIANSTVTYPATPPTDAPTEALIGRSDLFADNLASGALQGMSLANGRPLFLNDETDGVNADVLAEMGRVLAAGSTVHILGGTDAQGTGVEDALTAAGYTVNRFSGTTRTETAIDIATTVAADTALLVRSEADADASDDTQAFADALGAGALAATNGYSILFTQTADLTDTTAEFLAGDDAPANVIIVGGTLAVSAEVMTEVEGLVSGDVTRTSGPTRFDTAVELNGLRDDATLGDFAIAVDGQSDDSWADGFTQANLSGLGNYPLVLTNNGEVPTATSDYLDSINDNAFADGHLADAFVICGASTGDACAALAAMYNLTVVAFPAAGPTPGANNPTATSRPELVRADVGALVTASQASAANPVGLRVTYTFDEAIFTPTAANYAVFSSAGVRYGGTTATISATDPTMVTVIFGTVGTQTIVDSLTIAGTDRNAGLDSSGDFNIQGDFPIGAAATATPGQAGITSGPDLTMVANFRQAVGNTQTAVDFTFDENAWGANAALGAFQLIPADRTNPIVQCSGPAPGDTTASTPSTTIPSGNGSTLITVVCDNPAASTTPLAATSYTRGEATAGAVRDAAAAGNLNVAQVAQVSGGPALTSGLDLTAGSINLTATSGGTDYDSALFTFDQTVDTPLASLAGLTAYNADGTIVNPLAAPGAQVAGGQVLVYYANNSLTNAIGLQVAAGAINSGGNANRFDEIGVENTSTTDRAPGSTSNPELLSVALSMSTPPIGTPSNQATYVFDEDLNRTMGLTATGFDLFQADGTALVGATCAVGTTEDTDNMVVCTGYTVGAVAATSAQIGAAVVGGVDQNAAQSETGAAADSTVGSEVIG